MTKHVKTKKKLLLIHVLKCLVFHLYTCNSYLNIHNSEAVYATPCKLQDCNFKMSKIALLVSKC